MNPDEPKGQLAHPRHGWEQAFKRMAAEGDDQPLDETIPTLWDEQEWEW